MSEIDVSKCEYYRKLGKYHHCNYYDCECGDFNCNFKYEEQKKQFQQLKQENKQLKELNKSLSENNALQQWADMYNRKDKEHFKCQLKLARVEQKLEKIKEYVKKCNIKNMTMDVAFDVFQIIESEE